MQKKKVIEELETNVNHLRSLERGISLALLTLEDGHKAQPHAFG